MQNNTKPTYKRIVLLTKDGWWVYGDTYRMVDGGQVLYPDYIRDMHQQAFEELEKALIKHELTLSDIDRWFVEVVENGKEIDIYDKHYDWRKM